MYFIANWKMFGGLSTLNSLNKVIKFLKIFKKSNKTKIIYCPPSTLINPMFKKVINSKIQIGAQNCNESLTYGASTGSINPMMLKNVGAKYVILGHSENRESGETDKLINNKIKAATKSGLKVIFCIGETLGQKRKKITKKILSKQIALCLQKVNKKQNIIIAYEPVWSIGTGIIPKLDDLFSTINFIKKKVRNIKVLYGGSVNPKNINELKLIKNIDGFLIGGASQDPKKFIDIIKKTYN
ncbi:triose-phosphate isomerase [Pelagibacterales bacterium SAG-MED38]|nr:triose-phosphate isomerase [Pelagibacterales bacterium SAG-MED38]